jgi:Ca2+-binding EF-hand superfamily protein
MGSTQDKIDDKVYNSIAKYTELTKDDILAWQERFVQQCDPGSTTMTKEKFCKFYQELRPTENVKRLSENVFRAFDLDGDYGISFSEVSKRIKFLFSLKISAMITMTFYLCM